MCEVMYVMVSWAASPSREGFEERPSISIMTGTGRTTVHLRLSMIDATLQENRWTKWDEGELKFKRWTRRS